MDLAEQRPHLTIWETTQACDLLCQHCRADARVGRDPGELTTTEGERLLSRLAAARVPLVVLTGGDPAKREDLVELIAFGTEQGLNMALTPSATPLVTRELLGRVAAAGVKRLAVSVDGPDAATHDAFRRVPGSFDESLRILRAGRELGVPTQVNTTVHAGSIERLGEIAALVESLGSVLWSVFYLVPTGRAELASLPGATAVEATLVQLFELSERHAFAIKTTAAPHYRRVVLEQQRARRRASDAVAPGPGRDRAAGFRVNDGRGFLFVSHLGELFPSGFLPVSCGNVREVDPIDVYQRHATFRALRDEDRFEGKCGACEYRKVCGGSRGRAYAMEGSVIGSDPLCSYVPPGYQGRVVIHEQRPAPRALPVAPPSP
ncbi:MAG: TIGR04053 family radical SAM/SPASM domain-containing protein [Polyangiaceae bacterium]|nr:TIGR04053 family radical SAM/SPASM domain-containing protein [Polyangiaceae bacterium]